VSLNKAQTAGERQKEDEVSQKQAKHGAGSKITPIRHNITAGSAGLPRQEQCCPCGAMTLRRAQAHGKALGHDPQCSFYRERAIIV
jgi:hypothetical protein